MLPVPVEITLIQNNLLELIADELHRHPVDINPDRTKAGLGRSIVLGMVHKRGEPTDASRHSWRRPYLFFLLQKYGATLSIPWNAITVNEDYATAPHRDKGNEGVSYIVGFGNYMGGLLNCKGFGDFDIQKEGLIFNGATTTHSTTQFAGKRFSLVFYTCSKAPNKKYDIFPIPHVLQRRQIIQKQGFGLFHNGERIRHLTHALSNRKKTKAGNEAST